MSNVRAYLGDELDQKEPQKMISFALRTLIYSNEKIIALLGSAGLLNVNSYILSTEDFLLYFNNASLMTKNVAVLYTDLSDRY